MFKISHTSEFTHDVTVMVPTDGGYEEQKFRARFRVIPTDETEAFALDTGDGIKSFLMATVVGLEDLVDDDDKAIPFSDALRDRVLNLPYARSALLNTYAAAMSKARAGN